MSSSLALSLFCLIQRTVYPTPAVTGQKFLSLGLNLKGRTEPPSPASKKWGEHCMMIPSKLVCRPSSITLEILSIKEDPSGGGVTQLARGATGGEVLSDRHKRFQSERGSERNVGGARTGVSLPHSNLRHSLYENDPAAGSPTATLLRLLPLLAYKYYRILDRSKLQYLQTVLLTSHYRQRRAVCTRTRDVFGAF